MLETGEISSGRKRGREEEEEEEEEERKGKNRKRKKSKWLARRFWIHRFPQIVIWLIQFFDYCYLALSVDFYPSAFHMQVAPRTKWRKGVRGSRSPLRLGPGQADDLHPPKESAGGISRGPLWNLWRLLMWPVLIVSVNLRPDNGELNPFVESRWKRRMDGCFTNIQVFILVMLFVSWHVVCLPWCRLSLVMLFLWHVISRNMLCLLSRL